MPHHFTFEERLERPGMVADWLVLWFRELTS